MAIYPLTSFIIGLSKERTELINCFSLTFILHNRALLLDACVKYNISSTYTCKTLGVVTEPQSVAIAHMRRYIYPVCMRKGVK